MEREAVLDETSRPADAVALARTAPGRFLAAWSVEGVTRCVFLGGDAAPLGPSHRIDRFEPPPVDASKDAGSKTFWPGGAGTSISAEHVAVCGAGEQGGAVAMLERPDGTRPGGAYLALVEGDGGSIRVVRLGSAGGFAASIDVGVRGDEAIAVWHEGASETSRLKMALVSLKDMKVVSKKKISGRGALSGPAIAIVGSNAIFAWNDLDNSGGATRCVVRAAPVGDGLSLGEQVDVAECGFFNPEPSLTPAGGYEVGIAFRDERDDDEMPEYYFAVLGSDGSPLREPVRISRADGAQGVRIDETAGWFFGVAIRSFQRNLLVGMNRFDARGRKQGGEFQIYADRSNFTKVAVAAEKNRAVLIYAEDGRDKSRVLTSSVSCE
ncbi:MAG: hypothetical protein R6V85_04885 [Polyangia bacterium]